MKLKKKVKRIILIIILIGIVIGSYFVYTGFFDKEEVKATKIVSKIDKYGYQLKDTKPETYKKMFYELKDILEANTVDEDKYLRKITEMFIYDFYSLKDKTAKTDVGGVDFVYGEVLDNFLENAEDTYYKYVESNIYKNRKQSLPVVTNIEITSVEQEAYTYGDKTDDKAYKVNVKWSYTDDSFSDYQKEADLIFVHDDIKLSLVELQ